MNRSLPIWIFAALLALLCQACSPDSLRLEVESRQTLRGLASASGIEQRDDRLYAVGDNVPWVFRLDDSLQVDRRVAFSDYPLDDDNVIPKADKPDLEALTTFRDGTTSGLLAFGSGSITPQRDILLQMTAFNRYSLDTYSLTPAYDWLRVHPRMQDRDLNIEGAAVDGQKLYLLNRANNVMLTYPLRGFLRAVRSGETPPSPRIYELDLPFIDDLEAGLSGAALLPGTGYMIVTASVEDTPNAVADGQILGSFVGIIDLKYLHNGYKPSFVRVTEQGQELPIKVESVSVRNQSAHAADIVLVTDSDGGDSQIIRARLHLP